MGEVRIGLHFPQVGTSQITSQLEWMNEWINKLINELMKEWMNDLKRYINFKRVFLHCSIKTSDNFTTWINEWMNEWMDDVKRYINC